MRVQTAEQKQKRKDYHKAWYAKNRDRVRDLGRAWYRRNPDRAKFIAVRKHLLDKYGLTIEAWEQLRADHGYRCAICRRHESELGDRRLCVDHCHDTGQVRGMLCDDCNFGIGNLRENLHVIARAYDYIEKHKAERVA